MAYTFATMPYDLKVKGLTLDNGGGGGTASEKWLTIFADINDTGAPLNSIEVTTENAMPASISAYVKMIPYEGQAVRLVFDGTEYNCVARKYPEEEPTGIMVTPEEVIPDPPFLNAIIVGFGAEGTSIVFAPAGTHEIQLFVKKIDPDELVILNNRDGSETVPNTLFDAIKQQDLGFLDYLALITQEVPIHIIGSSPYDLMTPQRGKSAVVCAWECSITSSQVYTLLMFTPFGECGLKQTGGQ